MGFFYCNSGNFSIKRILSSKYSQSSRCVYVGRIPGYILSLNFLDLKKYLDSISPAQFMDSLLVKNYFYQIVQGIVFCHSGRAFLQDLKFQNLVITKKQLNWLIWALFWELLLEYLHTRGSSILVQSSTSIAGVGSLLNWIDIWSIDTVSAELATNKPFFHENSEIYYLFRIFKPVASPIMKCAQKWSFTDL